MVTKVMHIPDGPMNSRDTVSITYQTGKQDTPHMHCVSVLGGLHVRRLVDTLPPTFPTPRTVGPNGRAV